MPVSSRRSTRWHVRCGGVRDDAASAARVADANRDDVAAGRRARRAESLYSRTALLLVRRRPDARAVDVGDVGVVDDAEADASRPCRPPRRAGDLAAEPDDAQVRRRAASRSRSPAPGSVVQPRPSKAGADQFGHDSQLAARAVHGDARELGDPDVAGIRLQEAVLVMAAGEIQGFRQPLVVSARPSACSPRRSARPASIDAGSSAIVEHRVEPHVQIRVGERFRPPAASVNVAPSSAGRTARPCARPRPDASARASRRRAPAAFDPSSAPRPVHRPQRVHGGGVEADLVHRPVVRRWRRARAARRSGRVRRAAAAP